MQKLTPSAAPFFSRTALAACAAALLLGGVLVTPCSAAKPKASPSLSPSKEKTKAASSPSPSPSQKEKTAVTANPLLTESTLPYKLPPFDKIKDEHFQPALEQGMAEELKEAEAIAKQTEKPTFENTIVAMEKSGQLHGRARRVFSHFGAANTNPTIQKLEKEMAPKFAAHSDAIRLNGPLFARVEAIYNERESSGLDAESKWLLERYYKDFVRAGAKLSEADKTKLKAINAELATLSTDLRAERAQGEKCVVHRGRYARRAGRSFRERDRRGGRGRESGREGRQVRHPPVEHHRATGARVPCRIARSARRSCKPRSRGTATAANSTIPRS